MNGQCAHAQQYSTDLLMLDSLDVQLPRKTSDDLLEGGQCGSALVMHRSSGHVAWPHGTLAIPITHAHLSCEAFWVSSSINAI